MPRERMPWSHVHMKDVYPTANDLALDERLKLGCYAFFSGLHNFRPVRYFVHGRNAVGAITRAHMTTRPLAVPGLGEDRLCGLRERGS